MEYIIVALICFGLGLLYNRGDKNKLDTQIMSYLKAGKRVIVCVDDDATLFEMYGDRIRVTKAVANFIDEPIDLPRGVANGSILDTVGSSESDSYNETGMAD